MDGRVKKRNGVVPQWAPSHSSSSNFCLLKANCHWSYICSCDPPVEPGSEVYTVPPWLQTSSSPPVEFSSSSSPHLWKKVTKIKRKTLWDRTTTPQSPAEVGGTPQQLPSVKKKDSSDDSFSIYLSLSRWCVLFLLLLLPIVDHIWGS